MKDRYKGMLWGLVVGDCLGSPVQFTEKHHHKTINKMEPAVGIYGRDLPKGYWTDDTSMSIAIMESFVRLLKYDIFDIAENFIKWHDEGMFSSVPGWSFDIGYATSKSIRGLKNGVLKNGTEASQGNGSIMRFAPTYAIARKIGNDSIMTDVSDMTHNSNAIRRLILELAETFDELIHGKNNITSEHTRESVPNSGWAFDTIAAAKWAMASFKTFSDGMLAAVNLGGDSDSIGAVYGQMAGAFWGYEAIPKEWINDVKNHDILDNLIDMFVEMTI